MVPMKHILRGFIFEKAAEKDLYFLWQVVMPLYRPARAVLLNYSTRIPESGQKFNLTSEKIEEAASEILEIISNRRLSRLKALSRPSDFLEHIAWMAGNTTVNFRLDLALTHYMLGNVMECRRILEILESELTSSSPHYELVSKLVEELEADSSIVAQTIARWEDENVARLSLQAACVSVSSVE